VLQAVLNPAVQRNLVIQITLHCHERTRPYISEKVVSTMKTVVVKVDPVGPEPVEIEKAVELLKAGKLVAFPTDTVYGVGANVFNDEAVEQIFAVKKREPDKPLQVLIASKSDLQVIARIQSDALDRLASEFWPGGLTVVMPAREDFPHRVRCGGDTIGVRMPANAIALKLIETFGGPVAATSANVSGLSDPVNAEEVMEYLGGKIHLIIDGGPTPGNVPSTVVDISVHPPLILRQGKLRIEDLKRVLDVVV
jgi:L-threonylcarbamoyladenylate synthase